MKLTAATQLPRLAETARGRRFRRAAAFTLVEVLAAAAIAAIIFVGIFSAISSGNVVLQNTRENLRATQIIESRMEGLRLIAWGTDTNQLFNPLCFPTSFTETFYPLGLSGGSNNQGVVYYGSVSITNPVTLTPASSYSTQMCQVTVSVRWTNAHYGILNSHLRTMSTYVAKYGLQNYVYYATNR